MFASVQRMAEKAPFAKASHVPAPRTERKVSGGVKATAGSVFARPYAGGRVGMIFVRCCSYFNQRKAVVFVVLRFWAEVNLMI